MLDMGRSSAGRGSSRRGLATRRVFLGALAACLYNALTSLQGKVSPSKLAHDYLSEKFGAVGPVLLHREHGTGGP
jgi:hypothetical protein